MLLFLSNIIIKLVRKHNVRHDNSPLLFHPIIVLFHNWIVMMNNLCINNNINSIPKHKLTGSKRIPNFSPWHSPQHRLNHRLTIFHHLQYHDHHNNARLQQRTPQILRLIKIPQTNPDFSSVNVHLFMPRVKHLPLPLDDTHNKTIVTIMVLISSFRMISHPQFPPQLSLVMNLPHQKMTILNTMLLLPQPLHRIHCTRILRVLARLRNMMNLLIATPTPHDLLLHMFPAHHNHYTCLRYKHSNLDPEFTHRLQFMSIANMWLQRSTSRLLPNRSTI